MKSVWLSLILLLAFLLRFISLTDYPVGFNADEASFGYDSYSILKTGKDQWGEFLPMTLKSFGDYKSPLYAYLAIPFIAIFGLNEFASRLPNVLVGTLAVYIVWILSVELKKRHKIKAGIEIVSSMLFAINPWAIMLSRGAFEANLITLFIPLGVYLFLKDKLKLSALVFGLSLFTYHSAKFLSPVIFIVLIIVFNKKSIQAILIYAIFVFVMIFTLLNGAGARITERSITSGALEEGAREKILLIESGKNPIISRLLHNKYQVVVERFTKNYFQYVSPRFLFSQGAGEYYYGMVHGIGVIYLVEGVLLLGLIRLINVKKLRKELLFLVFWILAAPIPAALSTGVGYSGHRAIGMIPVLQILSAFGVFGWMTFFKKKNVNLRNFIVISVFGLLIINIYKFVNIYFNNVPKQAYGQMLYGNLEVADWLSKNAMGKTVFISRSLSEPQIFLAFTQKIDPEVYQNQTKNWNVTTWVDQIPEYSLNNYTVKSIDWDNDANLENVIIVARASEFPKIINPDVAFELPDGTPNIYVKTF